MCRKFFVSLLVSLFTFSILAQEGDGSANPDSSEITIDCKDLPKAVREYNADIQLNQNALTSALTEVSRSLEKALKNDKLSQSELLKMIKNLKRAKELSRKNEMVLLDRKSDIEYFLEECVKKIKTDS